MTVDISDFISESSKILILTFKSIKDSISLLIRVVWVLKYTNAY